MNMTIKKYFIWRDQSIQIDESVINNSVWEILDSLENGMDTEILELEKYLVVSSKD